MITLSINNEKKSIAATTSVEQLLAALNYEKHKVAVAVNGEFVPRSTYAQQQLNNGDQVDILTAVQGG